MADKEIKVAGIQELKDGQTKKIALEDRNILLCRVKGVFHAVGCACPHHGGPLDEGALHEDRLVCPWHHAVFSAKTGDAIEPPSLDRLPQYEVKTRGGDVYVVVADDMPATKRFPESVKPDTGRDGRVFVIVGAGAAGGAAAEALRQNGFQGRVVMITRESLPTYDRTVLSKSYLATGDSKGLIPIRNAAFYSRRGIEFLPEKTVSKVVPGNRVVEFSDGESLQFDKLLLATGGNPRSINVPGSDLKGIHSLRTPADADAIIASCKDARKAVVVGASFIGMEAAPGLLKRGLEVDVVGPEAVPFARILGSEIGLLIRKEHEKAGVRFHLGRKLREFKGEGRVQKVVLDDGTELDADLVVLGIGVSPSTSWLEETLRNPDGGLNVNAGMELLGFEGLIYAAGDIACYPDPLHGNPIRVEHWRVAQQQGRRAAESMCGKNNPEKIIPFFWSRQEAINLSYVGNAREWDEIHFSGDLAKKKFLAFYIKDGKVRAVLGVGREKEMMALAESARLGYLPELDYVRDLSIEKLSAAPEGRRP